MKRIMKFNRPLFWDHTTYSSKKMQNVPWIIGSMGLNILNYGIYRLNGGMRSYFYNLSLQIQKNEISINYCHELTKIKEIKKGFILTIYDKKTEKSKNVLVKNNLYLNITIWNFLELYQENNSFTKKLKQKIIKKSAWGACALYGYFEDNDNISEKPWYHQIFYEKDEINELKSSLYLSVYSREVNKNIRNFTATIHFKTELYDPEKKELYKLRLIERIENTLNLKVKYCEFASPKTFEKFTLRKFGKVGGFITNSYNMIFKPIPSIYNHPNQISRMYFVGDSVFPGQGIISSSISGIIACERSSNIKFNDIFKQ